MAEATEKSSDPSSSLTEFSKLSMFMKAKKKKKKSEQEKNSNRIG